MAMSEAVNDTIRQADPNYNRHPLGFWYIFWGELAERASFYGMRTLLLVYMIDKLGFSDANAGTITQLFTGFCYVLPIAGGFIADQYLGKFKTIIYFAIPYLLGHVILGTFDNEVGLFTALFLLAGGSGTIKPNISTLMGLMYQKQGKQHLMTQAFSWFYMAINIGAATTTFALPIIKNAYGFGPAFMAPTILMAVALGIFYLGKKHYPVEEIKRGADRIIRTPEQKREDNRTLVRLSGLFLMIVFFWSIFDQSQSTWTLFARDYMVLQINFFSWSWSVQPEAIQSFNPVLIVLMTPLFAWIWAKTDRSKKMRLSSPKKMLLGFVLVFLCMGVMAIAGYLAVDSKVPIIWELGAYILITMGELCISVIGLQLAFEEAPERMKSVITGIWLFTVFLGNLLAAWFARIYTEMAPGDYFGIMTIMIGIVAVLFYFIGRRFEHGAGNNQTANAAH